MPATRQVGSPNRMVASELHGFLKPKRKNLEPVRLLTEEELIRQRDANALILRSPTSSSRNSEWFKQLVARQVQIEKRLREFKNAREMDSITVGVENTSISEAERMDVDNANPAVPKPIAAKQRALGIFDGRMSGGEHTISFEEALKIEQARNKADNEEREKRESGQGLPQKDEKFSSEDIARQIHAFMSHKGSNSDMESDSDDDDPANWFHDDEDDGIKGQLIVQPDNEDYSAVIRIDETKAYVGYSSFFEPRD